MSHATFISPQPRRESAVDAGILLTNLGSPDAPTPKALRKYLREFLGDPRVIELNRVVWWLILNGIVLRTRPAKSAHAYQQVWTPEGAPLIVGTRSLAHRLEAELSRMAGRPVAVAMAMRYGAPSIADGLDELDRRGVRRVLVLPLYPQYAAATTATTFDALGDALKRRRLVPQLRFVADYHAEPAWIAAVTASVRERWATEGEPDFFLMSFHGVPVRYVRAGDPYQLQCMASAKQIVEMLGWPAEKAGVAFQSRFGREPWITPYTDEELVRVAKAGVKKLDVACPGFSIDCLETLEEIAMQGRETFLAAGGEQFRYVSALNDSPRHVDALAAIASRQIRDWLDTETPPPPTADMPALP